MENPTVAEKVYGLGFRVQICMWVFHELGVPFLGGREYEEHGLCKGSPKLAPNPGP